MSRNSIDLKELDAFMSGYWLSDLANFSAYIFEKMPDLNWAGFYLDDNTKLRLGPFQGKPACLEIAYNKGVCGQSFQNRASLIVEDVDQFPGHIRCDANSRSELVVPFYVGGNIVGVLDLDSPQLSRFTEIDREEVEAALLVLSSRIKNFPLLDLKN